MAEDGELPNDEGLARDRAALKAAEPDSAGEKFVERGAQIVIDRRPIASDREAAADPATQDEHRLALDATRRLAQLAARRHNRLTDIWGDLRPTGDRLLAALDVPTAELPERLAEMYGAVLALGSLLEQDRALRDSPEPGEEALPLDLQRSLGDALTFTAILARAFPTNRRRDARLRDFWRPEAAEQARAVFAKARAEALFTPDDDTLIGELERSSMRPGSQAEKAQGRSVATARNLLLISASLIVVPALLNAYTGESELMKRTGRFIAQTVDPTIEYLFVGMPPDIAAAIRNAAERAKMLDAPIVLPPPAPQWRDPDPDFDLDEVKRMILAGQAPPPEWVPFITELSFSDEPLMDLDPLRGLTSLQTLNLDDTQISDLGPLLGLTSLLTLTLNGTPVSNLYPIRGLSRLRSLFLNRTQVDDLDPLRGLTSLQTLWLDSTGVSELDPLQGLTSLQSLWLDYTQVSDLDPLRGLSSLQELMLANTPISDLAPLQGLTSLQMLWLNSTQVSDLDPLRGLTNLQLLWVNNTQVTDLTPIAGLSKLTSLEFGRTHVSDLSPIAGLDRLQDLRFGSAPVTDLTALAGLANLVVLDCGGSPIDDVSPLLSIHKLRVLRVRTEARNGDLDLQSITRAGSVKHLYIITSDSGGHSEGHGEAGVGDVRVYWNGPDFEKHASEALRLAGGTRTTGQS